MNAEAYRILIVKCYEFAAEACEIESQWNRYMRIGDYLQFRRMRSLRIPATVELTHYPRSR